jgi:hypothetical protein
MCVVATALLGVNSQTRAASIYESTVLADGPLAYYRLNETSGTTATNIGTATGIDGTYVNIPGMTANNTSNYGQAGPQPANYPGFEATNTSAFYDPENGSTATSNTFPRVEVPVANGLNPLAITGTLTLEAWIKVSGDAVDPSNNQGIVGRYRQDGDPGTTGTQPGRAYVLYYDTAVDMAPGPIGSTPGLGFALSTDGAFQSANSYEFASSGLNDGNWHHVAIVWEKGVRVEAYVDGASIGTVTTSVLNANLFSGMADFWIGQQFTGADEWTFEGNIDEVAVYTAALTDQQIAAHYAAAIPEPAMWQLLAIVFGLAIHSRRR